MGLLRVERTGFGLKEPTCRYDLCDLRESLLNLTYYLEFFCVCRRVCAVQVCMHRCAYTLKRSTVDLLLQELSALIFETGSVIGIWDFLVRLNWLAS